MARHSKPNRRRAVSVAASLAAAIATLPLLVGTAPTAASATDAPTESCGWVAQLGVDKLNVLFPDTGATYWIAALPVPAGGSIEIDGQFPHARYTSLTTYNELTQAIDGINDQAIAPDPGSVNPFLPGADRTATSRNYTVHIVNAQLPKTGRATNTVYLENADGSKSMTATGLALFVLRIYVPDEGDDTAGAVPLPTLSLDLSSGQKITLPTCPDLTPSTTLAQTIATLNTLVPDPITGLMGQNPPAWRKYTNLLSATEQMLLDNQVLGPLFNALKPTSDSLLPAGGFLENPDNKYVTAAMDDSFGQVLVLHAKAPTTPHTLAGESVMGTGQLRYWSMCSNSGPTTAVYGCVYDEQVPVDSQGYYTMVVSSPNERPANATVACGVAWLPAGPLPHTVLILRNMLADPSFTESVQSATVGHEQADMGPYYPSGTYYPNAASFEKLGCPAWTETRSRSQHSRRPR